MLKPFQIDKCVAYFKAYRQDGECGYYVWTRSPATEQMERAVFRERLNRGDFVAVDIAYGDPQRRNETMLPEEICNA